MKRMTDTEIVYTLNDSIAHLQGIIAENCATHNDLNRVRAAILRQEVIRHEIARRLEDAS